MSHRYWDSTPVSGKRSWMLWCGTACHLRTPSPSNGMYAALMQGKLTTFILLHDHACPSHKLGHSTYLMCTVDFALQSCMLTGWDSTMLVFTQCRIKWFGTASFSCPDGWFYDENATRQNGCNMLNWGCIWRFKYAYRYSFFLWICWCNRFYIWMYS